jgi:ubiquinone/menaquinone biosynthesis C-methylase UbiE
MNKDWYKYNSSGSFFGSFYKRGDSSLGGYLRDRKLTITERTTREVDGIIRLLGLNINHKLLDVPCGYGRHLRRFVEMGYNVTGVDININFIDNLINDLGTNSNVFQGEMLKLPLESTQYDAVINMFFSFGFYDNDCDNIQCMREMYRVLKKSGQLLIHSDVNMKKIYDGSYLFNEERALSDGGKLLIGEKYDKETKRLNGVWTILKNTGVGEAYEYSMRVYSVDEYEMMGRCAGFRDVKVYGSFDIQNQYFDESSEEIIIVFQK